MVLLYKVQVKVNTKVNANSTPKRGGPTRAHEGKKKTDADADDDVTPTVQIFTHVMS